MIGTLLEKIEAALSPPASRPPDHSEHVLQLAAAVLMVEVMRADHHMAAEEEDRLAQLISGRFGLDNEETADLIRLAHGEADQAVSLHGFTRQLTDSLDVGERTHVIELLWELAYADGHIDKYEEHLIRQIAEWMYVPHTAFVRARHRAAERAPGNQAR